MKTNFSFEIESPADIECDVMSYTCYTHSTYQYDLLAIHQRIFRLDVTVEASCVWQGMQTANWWVGRVVGSWGRGIVGSWGRGVVGSWGRGVVVWRGGV